VTSEDKGIAMTRELRDYLVDHSIAPTAHHAAIISDTLTAAEAWSIMQIPREQGPLMTLLARLVGARLAVEVGTFTGYSALCIALGLAEGGRLVCFDVSEEWPAIGRPHWDAAGVGDRIEVRTGPAADTLATLGDEPIDLVFLDADKPGYLGYYEELLPRIRPGGLLLADNTLWSGQVVDATDTHSNTRALREFNDHVAADERVDVVILPFSDGVTLAYKRP
jgi:caffeoyl-CoA O-methyltransferase